MTTRIKWLEEHLAELKDMEARKTEIIKLLNGASWLKVGQQDPVKVAEFFVDDYYRAEAAVFEGDQDA